MDVAAAPLLCSVAGVGAPVYQARTERRSLPHCTPVFRPTVSTAVPLRTSAIWSSPLMSRISSEAMSRHRLELKLFSAER